MGAPNRGRRALLGHIRVLDLSDGGALICGQILADLGADVVQIEPPGGAAARRLGPYAGGTADPERSLFWWSYARGKRGLVLDLDTEAGRSELALLAKGADVLIESAAPGELARHGLGHAALAALNPALVVVSITPFGQDGPRAHEAATDLSVLAAAGLLALTGDADRAPLRVPVPQAFLHAGAEAAVGALVALHERAASGLGQHVDVSAQQAATVATQAYLLATPVGASPATRVAGGVQAGPLRVEFTYPAKDGFVSITHLFGSTVGPATRRLMEWVHECGFCDEATRDKDWIAYTELLITGKEPIAEFERVKRVIAACTASKTKAELLQAARDRALLMAPVRTIAEVVESEQLAAREWVTPLTAADGSSVRYPGPFAKFPAAPIRYRRSAPRLDEHAAEIRAERRPAARSGSQPSAARPGAQASSPDRRPLEGVKVLDFMWAVAGPLATRVLADHGATVIRIESSRRLDVCRTILPFVGGKIGAETASLFHSTNVGKRMLTLDPGKPEGRQTVLDLVRWADVVCESFTPKGMKGFGLDYATLRQHKPDLIMLSTCLMGQTGPLAGFAGYGNLAAAMTGFYDLTGWPDRPPAGPFGAYTDYIAPRFNAAAILAALEHRRLTGEGQHIDLAQAEASLHFLAPAILDYTVNGIVTTRGGNRDRELAPHGVYPCAGKDRWVAIAARDDRDWRALCEALGAPALARRALRRRRARPRDALDAVLAASLRRSRWRRSSAVCTRPLSRRAASTTAPRPRATRSSRIAGTSSRSLTRPRARRWSRPRASGCRARRLGWWGPPRASATARSGCSRRCSATTTIASPSSPSPARSSELARGPVAPGAAFEQLRAAVARQLP
jgi:crotonobetainyl-CoA:carnitine CoA-transferase CaiB-like acyl-CoA transferase